MRYIKLICCLLLAAAILCGCSGKDDAGQTSDSDVSVSDVSASDESSGPVFDEAQLAVIGMIEGNAQALVNGEPQMYMAAIMHDSEQYEQTQKHVVELCEKYTIAIELDFISVEIDGDRALVTVNQLTTYTPRDGSPAVTYETLLKHRMISRSGIWNISSTVCESTVLKHKPEDMLKPIYDGAAALASRKVDDYMATISPESDTYDDTRGNFWLMAAECNISTEILEYEFLEETSRSAEVLVRQKTVVDNYIMGHISTYESTLIHKLVYIDGVWYVDSTENVETVLLEKVEKTEAAESAEAA